MRSNQLDPTLSFEGFVKSLLRRPKLVIVVISLLTAIGAFGVFRTGFESAIEVWFIDNDPNLLLQQEFTRNFHADEILLVTVFADDVFAPEVLAGINRLTSAAQDIPNVYKVRSLTNVRVIESDDETISIQPLIKRLPVTVDEAEILRRKALADPLLEGMVAGDSKAAAIVIEIKVIDSGMDFDDKAELIDLLDQAIEKEKIPARLVVAGQTASDAATLNDVISDIKILGPLSAAVVVLVILIVFRRASAAAIPLSVITISLIWVFGIMGYAGVKVNVLTIELVGVVVAVGVAHTVHVLSEYYQKLFAGQSTEDAIVESIVTLLAPCTFTTLTTIAGMLSLCTNQIKPIRDFGFFAAVGVAFTYILSMTLVPVILRIARPPDAAFIERRKNGAISRMLVILGKPGRGRSLGVLLGSSLLLLICAFGVNRLELSTNPINYFKPDHPVRLALLESDNALGSSASLEFIVDSEEEVFTESGSLAKIDGFQQWLDEQEGVSTTMSVTSSLKELRRAFFGGALTEATTPETDALAAQLYLMLEGEDAFEAFVKDDYTTGRISARVPLSASELIAGRMEHIEKRIAQDFADTGIRVRAAGLLKLISGLQTYLIEGLLTGFALAFLLISGAMFFMLRSIKLGLLAMIPNLLPIIIGLGFMAYAGIPLDPGSAMVASVTLGLVVDDTIHFLIRLRRNLGAGVPQLEAILLTMNGVGRAIIITTIVLSSGFGILALSSFMPNIYFGIVAALIIFIALVADLVVLPSVLVLLDSGGKPTTETT